MRARTAGLVAILLLAPALPVEGQTVTDSDRFFFFAECAPVGYSVSMGDDDLSGLTNERVRTMVESRLRAARLYADGPADVFLQLAVTVFRNAFAFNADMGKRRPDSFAPPLWWLPTTSLRSPRLGTHGGDTGFIMQGLTEEVDRLISEYLRVNEGYC